MRHLIHPGIILRSLMQEAPITIPFHTAMLISFCDEIKKPLSSNRFLCPFRFLQPEVSRITDHCCADRFDRLTEPYGANGQNKGGNVSLFRPPSSQFCLVFPEVASALGDIYPHCDGNAIKHISIDHEYPPIWLQFKHSNSIWVSERPCT